MSTITRKLCKMELGDILELKGQIEIELAKRDASSPVPACDWGQLSRTGECGKPAVCFVWAPGIDGAPTCSYHRKVAGTVGWKIRDIKASSDSIEEKEGQG